VHAPPAAAAVASPPPFFAAARRAAAGALAGAVAAGALALAPLPASAVSGGGGSGNSLAFADLSGKDLRKQKFIKGDLRGELMSIKSRNNPLFPLSYSPPYTSRASPPTRRAGANLSKVMADGTSFFGSLAPDADFSGASLRGADMESMELSGARLDDADLTGALLTNAQLGKVKSIRGADFTDALIRPDIARALCKIAEGTNAATGVETRESLGCS
jgi:uncharacterized protein YjbI with pentapeptide repeats